MIRVEAARCDLVKVVGFGAAAVFGVNIEQQFYRWTIFPFPIRRSLISTATVRVIAISGAVALLCSRRTAEHSRQRSPYPLDATSAKSLN
jgi:hypothetical protein